MKTIQEYIVTKPRQDAILNVLIKLKNDAKSESTIKFVDKALVFLSKHADLTKPEQVRQFIAQKEGSDGYKRNLCLAYDHYANYYQIEWKIPQYKQEEKMRRIPTTHKLETLIAAAGKILSIKLQMSKETGLRPIEQCRLKVKGIDLEQRMIYPTTAKGGNPRSLMFSPNLQAKLAKHIKTYGLTENDELFKRDAEHYGKQYRKMRNKLAEKMNDPNLKAIRLYDFRHYFATHLYDRTKDILLVMKKLGHKRISTTMHYTQLITFNDSEEYTCKTASNLEEASDLIEHGFQYITEMDGLKLFRKRK